ncbi:MAG: hypothetical protein C4582_08105, partial [Desulfobacteraceae bacterium]
TPVCSWDHLPKKHKSLRWDFKFPGRLNPITLPRLRSMSGSEGRGYAVRLHGKAFMNTIH